ncbi:MAG TPA: hypothetical protein VF510_03370 [Ktedonobacterales bacterium]
MTYKASFRLKHGAARVLLAAPLLIAVIVLAACTGTTTGAGGSSTGGSQPTSTSASAPAGMGGAHITKPFDRTVTGAQCYAGTNTNKGKAAFGFPNRDLTSAALSFTLGPLTDGSSPGQEKNAPYTGAGSYGNIGIVVRSESGQNLIGYGNVTVNSDLRTGSFKLTANGGEQVEGTWDCGRAVNP